MRVHKTNSKDRVNKFKYSDNTESFKLNTN